MLDGLAVVQAGWHHDTQLCEVVVSYGKGPVVPSLLVRKYRRRGQALVFPLPGENTTLCLVLDWPENRAIEACLQPCTLGVPRIAELRSKAPNYGFINLPGRLPTWCYPEAQDGLI